MFWKKKSAPKTFRKDVDPNDLPIEDVWAEFLQEFRVDGVPFDQLPHAREATAWLKPPTQCPVAQAFLRFAVSETRLGKSIGDMDSFYDSGEPPQATLIGAQSLSNALGIEFWIYYEESNQEMVWKLRPQV